MSILEALKADDYRMGACQAVVYDRHKTKVFAPGFLSRLYFSFLGDRYSKRDPNGTGILEVGFCGCNDLSHDAIVQFWMTHPTVILGIWDGDVFKPAGCCFPSQVIGGPRPNERAAFCGYLFMREWWGSEEQEVLALLGIAIMFREIDLVAMHGSRYEGNDATAKFMARFGFTDLANLPNQMLRGDKLVSGVVSTVTRATFEARVEEMVLKAYLAAKNLP